jgi:hypothetical protein
MSTGWGAGSWVARSARGVRRHMRSKAEAVETLDGAALALRERVRQAYSAASRRPEERHPLPVGSDFARNRHAADVAAEFIAVV